MIVPEPAAPFGLRLPERFMDKMPDFGRKTERSAPTTQHNKKKQALSERGKLLISIGNVSGPQRIGPRQRPAILQLTTSELGQPTERVWQTGQRAFNHDQGLKARQAADRFGQTGQSFTMIQPQRFQR